MLLAALGTYVLAVLTDLLDGYLARQNKWTSDLGKVLDPLADKLMLIAAVGCFYFQGWVPLWLTAIVVGKELIMIVGGAMLYKKDIVVYADWFGKIATIFFNVGAVATMGAGFLPWLKPWSLLLLFIAIISALIAMVHYAQKNVFAHRKAEQVQAAQPEQPDTES